MLSVPISRGAAKPRRVGNALVVAIATAWVAATAAPVAAAPSGSAVQVETVAQLEAALAGSASTIEIAPGEYVVDATIALEDVDLIGSGDGVVFRHLDPNLAAVTQAPLFQVAGDVLLDNVDFEGGGFTYVGPMPAVAAQKHNRITITDSRFVTGLFDPFDPDFVDPPEPRYFISAVLLGNLFAGPEVPANTWDVDFTNNYVDGGFAGLVLGDFASDSSGGEIKATVERNVFHGSLDPGLVVLGSFSGSNATVTGTSTDNVYTGLDNPFGFGSSGLSVNAGISSFNDPGSAGGSFADVEWTSQDEEFAGSGGIFVTGGRRYTIDDGISQGNDVRIRILSPKFVDSVVRDITIAASSINFPDPAFGDFAANGDGEGNTVTVTLGGADFSGDPGRVWIRNHAGTEFDAIPPMPAEPSYANEAVFSGSPEALESTNPGVNEIPAAYFTGGGH